MDQQLSEAEEMSLKKNVEKQIEVIRAENKNKADRRSEIEKAVKNRPTEPGSLHLINQQIQFTKNVGKLGSGKLGTDDLLIQLSKLDLHDLYVKQVASIIVVKAKLREKNVAAAVDICINLHKKYAVFASLLLEAWKKVLSPPTAEMVENHRNVEVDILFFSELISSGVLTPEEGLPLLDTFLSNFIQNNDNNQHEYYRVSLILALCKICGAEFAGLVSRKLAIDAFRFELTVPRRDEWLSPSQRLMNVTVFLDYYHSLCDLMIEVHKKFLIVEMENSELGTSESIAREKAVKDNLLDLTFLAREFADILNEEMPNPDNYLAGFDPTPFLWAAIAA